MGRPKPLLSWHSVPLVGYQIASLLEGGVSEVVVVLGHEHEKVEPHIKGHNVRSVFNPDYLQGRTTSIKAGLAVLDPGRDVLLLGVDQPRPPEVVRAVLESHIGSSAPITSPRHKGHGGHPLAFSSRLRDELESITEEGQGLREVFANHRDDVNEVLIDDPIVLLDVNDPDAYEEARKRFSA